MHVDVLDRQNDLPIAAPQVEQLAASTLNYLGITCDEVAIHLVSEKEICELHAQFFDDPSPTDCITLPIEQSAEQSPGYHSLGELFVCPAVLLDEEEPYTEASLCIAHSILHLIGYHDHTEAMRSKEKEVMEHLKKAGLLLSG